VGDILLGIKKFKTRESGDVDKINLFFSDLLDFSRKFSKLIERRWSYL